MLGPRGPAQVTGGSGRIGGDRGMSNRGAEGAGPSGAADGRDGERRAAGGSRVHFEALVAVGEDAGGSFEAESVDVSPDGMRLRTAYLPSEGDKLVCRFDGLGSEIVAEGEVLWRNEEARGGEFGLRFPLRPLEAPVLYDALASRVVACVKLKFKATEAALSEVAFHDCAPGSVLILRIRRPISPSSMLLIFL